MAMILLRTTMRLKVMCGKCEMNWAPEEEAAPGSSFQRYPLEGAALQYSMQEQTVPCASYTWQCDMEHYFLE